MYQKILLPTDGSGYAEQEVDRVTKLIADDGEIIVLSVAGKLTSSAFQSRNKVRKVNERLLKEAKTAVKSMADKFDDSLNVKTIVRTGFPAETINEVVAEEGVELIVISASGKSGLHRLIIGSVAEKVLKTADIDVLLIHNNEI
ncbi:universal stress protein [uncultured Methanobrevibacter sp.]|uniref:universal stress protein n=1 Tax=uncultured Methanobrevibacter sp. TaxID=253161 RepID=UPI0026342390|nr:universal stress protein [uncultured Methanobrevibacter sp.]